MNPLREFVIRLVKLHDVPGRDPWKYLSQTAKQRAFNAALLQEIPEVADLDRGGAALLIQHRINENKTCRAETGCFARSYEECGDFGFEENGSSGWEF